MAMISEGKQPLVSIGLPAYDRPHFLRQALESLTRQTYQHLEIIVSDDCSPGDGTANVVREFMEKDDRIRFYRQEENLGHCENHRFVVEKARGEYFFWASEDDEWDEKYFETGIKSLTENPGYDAWCCTIKNTDSFGHVIRDYPGFSRWTSTKDKKRDLIRYLLEPEIMGKSHVFHSIFRVAPLKETISKYWFNEEWGTDMCLGIAFLTRFTLLASDEVLFSKRVVRAGDKPHVLNPIVVQDATRKIFPLSVTKSYIREYRKAAHGTPYESTVVLTMLLRVPIAVRNSIWSNQIQRKISRKTRRVLSATGISVLRDFVWRYRYGYTPDPLMVDVRWSSVRTHGFIKVPLNVLRSPIHTSAGIRLRPIEETPHYEWIRSLVAGHDDPSSRQAYRQYLETYYPEEDMAAGLDHVRATVSSFLSEILVDGSVEIVTYAPTYYRGDHYIVIYDGVHRSAIAKALGHEIIRCRLVPMKTDSNDFASRILGGPTDLEMERTR
jgi:glycosyltransferase involved in cell wall biosynthesis